MTESRNQHSAPGGRDPFPTTRWSGIGDPDRHVAMRDELYRQYREPLYCFARRRGYASQDAEEFTQGFLVEILMGREFLCKADRSRGRFRSLLVKTFQHYISNSRRRKRVPTGVQNDVSEYELPDVVPHDPSDAFDYAWASNVLDAVLAELESECRREGLEAHWGIFLERVVTPILDGRSPPGMEEVCRKYAASSEGQASNMIVTVKRRFRRILVRHLVGQGCPEEQAQEAVRDFLDVFSQFRRA